jgi:hypothetical protein
MLIPWRLRFLCSLSILDISPLSDEYLGKIFSHSVEESSDCFFCCVQAV